MADCPTVVVAHVHTSGCLPHPAVPLHGTPCTSWHHRHVSCEFFQNCRSLSCGKYCNPYRPPYFRKTELSRTHTFRIRLPHSSLDQGNLCNLLIFRHTTSASYPTCRLGHCCSFLCLDIDCSLLWLDNLCHRYQWYYRNHYPSHHRR